MRREQYDDMLKFSSPPTDAEILGFLRKYDLSTTSGPLRPLTCTRA